eukprot:365428-Chlamydomonas_euryale.AAC.20
MLNPDSVGGKQQEAARCERLAAKGRGALACCVDSADRHRPGVMAVVAGVLTRAQHRRRRPAAGAAATSTMQLDIRSREIAVSQATASALLLCSAFSV